MERIAPAGDVYQAGTLSGTRSRSPPASRRCALLDEEAYAAPARDHASARRRACARRRGDGVRVQVVERHRAC